MYMWIYLSRSYYLRECNDKISTLRDWYLLCILYVFYDIYKGWHALAQPGALGEAAPGHGSPAPTSFRQPKEGEMGERGNYKKEENHYVSSFH